MDLSEPLRGLAGGAEAAVLRVIARSDAGFSGRQLHQLAGVGSTSSVHRALTGLVRLGLLTAERRPPAVIYRANREHVLWPAVEAGLAARARVFESIDAFCTNEWPGGLDITVVVYGSVARRESTADSDIDLFVVYPEGLDADAEADLSYRLANHVELITGNAAQVYALGRAEYVDREREREPLVRNVLAEGVLVHGSPLPTTRSRVSA